MPLREIPRCAATAALKIVRRKQNCRGEVQSAGVQSSKCGSAKFKVQEFVVQSAGVQSSKCGSSKFKVFHSVFSVPSVAKYSSIILFSKIKSSILKKDWTKNISKTAVKA